jgi:hypothetical protein
VILTWPHSHLNFAIGDVVSRLELVECALGFLVHAFFGELHDIDTLILLLELLHYEVEFRHNLTSRHELMYLAVIRLKLLSLLRRRTIGSSLEDIMAWELDGLR